jgi:cytochrome c biogenesis protein CcdA
MCVAARPRLCLVLSCIGLEQLRQGQQPRGGLFAASLAFVADLCWVFISFGAQASVVGQFLRENRALLAPVAGALIPMFGLLSLPKTVFALSQLNLNGKNDSLQQAMFAIIFSLLRSIRKDFELGLRFKPRSLPFGISSWSFSARPVHTSCV